MLAGITLSPRQVGRGMELARERGLNNVELKVRRAQGGGGSNIALGGASNCCGSCPCDDGSCFCQETRHYAHYIHAYKRMSHYKEATLQERDWDSLFPGLHLYNPSAH
jgi:hypothetical protein